MKYNIKRLGKIWYDMQNRCYNEKCKAFKNYGKKGITVCKDWRDSYLLFENWALQNGYEETLTIDRIDVTKGYSPINCRWVSKQDQCNNKSINIFIEHNGEIKTISQWAKTMNMSVPAFWARVNSPFATEERIFRKENNKKLPRRRGI